MAKTIEQLQAELEAARLEAANYKAAAETARVEAESLATAMKTAKANGSKVSEPVPGSFLATWKSPNDGDQKSRKVEFKAGRLRVILPKIAGMEQQAGMYVMSESLLLLANGKPAKPEHLALTPALALLDEAKAATVLTHFAAIDAGFLK